MPTAPRGFDFKLRRQVMTIRKLAFALAFGSVLFVGGSSLATQGSGVTPMYKVVSSNADIFVQTVGNRLKLRFGSKKASINILNVHQVFAPGAFSGWHTHSGPGIVIVEQGTLTTEETEGCFVDYPQGSVLFEGGPGHIHNALNRTNTPVILDAYFFLPAFVPPGGNSRVDEPVQTGPCGAVPNETDDDDRDEATSAN
jgi:quercetin dioxygenase-like cupin family protein